VSQPRAVTLGAVTHGWIRRHHHVDRTRATMIATRQRVPRRCAPSTRHVRSHLRRPFHNNSATAIRRPSRRSPSTTPRRRRRPTLAWVACTRNRRISASRLPLSPLLPCRCRSIMWEHTSHSKPNTWPCSTARWASVSHHLSNHTS